jgi:gamma-glutamylputrescine synthase
VEYRVAGADANPYLVMATILSGIVYGLDNELPLQEPVTGNGLEQDGLPFPIRQSDALYEFEHQQVLNAVCWVKGSAMFIWPAKRMSWCSLSVW